MIFIFIKLKLVSAKIFLYLLISLLSLLKSNRFFNSPFCSLIKILLTSSE